jgi:hypothetical protein
LLVCFSNKQKSLCAGGPVWLTTLRATNYMKEFS